MTANIVILTIVFAVVAILSFIALTHRKGEDEGFVTSLTSENAFLKSQENIFWNNTNKALMTNSGLQEDLKNVTKAFFITDTLANSKNRKTDVSHYFEVDNLPGHEAANQTCAGVVEPKFLPNRENKYGKGCGWWYVNDTDKPSVGSMGTNLGPFKDNELKTSHPGGKWMWDLNEAQKKEDEKRCRKIKSCDMADLVPGKCGFCPNTSKGVPISKNGLALYPDDENLRCESTIITNHLNCPKPPPPAPPPGSAPGTPPPVPPAALCDPNPGSGKLSNECLISLAQGTGCTTSGAIISILSGDPTGYYSQPGEDNAKFQLALEAIKTGSALDSPGEFFGFGTCTRSEALGYYNSIVKIAAAGPTPQSRAAAGFLAKGSDFDECNLDDGSQGPFPLHCLQLKAREAGCQPDGSDYPAEGLQKQTRNIPKFCGKFGKPSPDGNIRLYNKTECDKLSGSFYANGECTKKEGGSYSWDCRELNEADLAPRSTKDIYDQMSWGNFIMYFRNLYNEMHSSDISKVIRSTKKCLGVDITMPEEDCGDVKGVYYYVYKWDYDYNTATGAIPKAFYFGRFIKDKFVEISNNGQYTPFGIGTDRIFMRLKGRIKQNSGTLVTKIWVQTDDGVAISIDGKSVMQKYWDQGPTAYETPNFIISSDKETTYEMNWYNNYGGYVLIPKIFIDGSYKAFPSDMLKLNQPAGYPFARWDFFEGIVEDRCGTFDTKVVGSVPFATVDGKKCMLFGGQNYIQIPNGLAMSAFKSISMMIYVKSNHQGWPRLWEFNNTPLGNYNQGNGAWCQDSLFGCASPNNGSGFGFYAKKGCGGPDAWSGGNTVEVGKWYHVVWTLDDSFDTMTMYIDGRKSFSQKGASSVLNKDKTYKNLYIVNSVEYFNKDMAVAWFRMYDYTLTEKDINMDRMNKFSSKTLFPVSSSAGW